MKNILNRLFEQKSLAYDEAKEILTNIGLNKYNSSEVAAFMTVYLMRNITIDELAGFRDALLDLCIKIDLSDFETIDLCGTGGDGKDTFNISTLSSFVVAGAGYKVAKHGNYGVSSGCGSSNVLEYFGYKFTNNEEIIRKSIDNAGICFLHAPLFHPALKNVGPIRRELRVKTFFNILGPMVNPSFPKNQMVGVFNLEVARLYAYLYQQSKKNFTIVHSIDGYDEISLTSNFKLIGNQTDEILGPEFFGFNKIAQSDIVGGYTVESSAKIFESVLNGEATENQMNVVIANSAIAIKTIDNQISIEKSMELARKSIFDKQALHSFQKLIEISKTN
jgi:anthranilate phosphoribosyltransferase